MKELWSYLVRKLNENYGLESNIDSMLIYWIWLLCYGYMEDCTYLLE